MNNSKSIQIDMIIESEVEDLFGDIIREGTQGIGGSDLGACIRNIKRRLKDIKVVWDTVDIEIKMNQEMRKIEGEI